MVALGTDGAAVMVGEVGGVFALLKHDIPHVIKVHCIAHRLEQLWLFQSEKRPRLFFKGYGSIIIIPLRPFVELKELAEGMQVRAYKAVKARWHQMGTPFEANFRCFSFEGLLHGS